MTTTTRTITALVIPVEGPLETVELPTENALGQLQGLVGGYIEQLTMPDFIANGLVIVNEEGKYTQPRNPRATDFMVPGAGLRFGDYIAGPAILVGTGPDGRDCPAPEAAVKRARLIEEEAA